METRSRWSTVSLAARRCLSGSADHLYRTTAGEFYGQAPHGTLGLELLSRFFAAEPSYASRIFLSVKGGLSARFQPDSSLENLRKSAENINRILKHRKMDLFEPARVDTTRPIEEVGARLQARNSSNSTLKIYPLTTGHGQPSDARQGGPLPIYRPVRVSSSPFCLLSVLSFHSLTPQL